VGRLNGFAPNGWVTPLRTGTWRVRDAAAHIAVWDRLLAETIRALPTNQLPDWLSWDDARTDEVNEQQVRNSTDWPLDQLRLELRQARAEVLDEIARLDEGQFSQSHRSGAVETSAEKLCAWWLSHDREHFAELPT
jgi:DinB superfamily